MDSSFRTVRLLVSLGLTLALGACGDDISTRVSCTTAAECGQPTDMTTAECCGGYCVATSAGCTSGYRYLTSEPEFGACVETSMCPVAPDMSISPDLAKPNADAGK